MLKIKQRRLQILVHSCIYYEYDTNIVSDAKWTSWAKELVQLQKEYPEEAKCTDWASQFENFNGSTGMDLPVKDTWVMNKALELLHYKGEKKYSVPVEHSKEQLLGNSVNKPKLKRRKLF